MCQVAPQSPAEVAGLLPRDLLVTIDDNLVFDMTHDEAVGLVQRAENRLCLVIERCSLRISTRALSRKHFSMHIGCEIFMAVGHGYLMDME